MLEIAIMVEGQNGLNWPRWQQMAKAVEALGFAGLYRSDHYTNAKPPNLDSLELWVSLTWLATNTQRIHFGSLVTPMSFRDPVMTARMASAVDDLSSGRLTLGLGAGWQEREHANYGWNLLSVRQRFRRFEEALQIITHLFHSAAPINFDGEFYHLHDAVLLPRPARPGGPPILIGGNGLQLTLPLAAKYASEWNATFQTPENFRKLNAQLDELIEANGRRRSDVVRSTMTGCVFGRNQAEVEQKAQGRGQTAEQLRDRGILVGTGPEVAEQIKRLEEAGVQRIMLQWLELDDLDGLGAMAREVLPQFKKPSP